MNTYSGLVTNIVGNDRIAKLLDAYQDSLPYGMLIMDAEGKTVLFNRSFAEMFGLPGSSTDPGQYEAVEKALHDVLSDTTPAQDLPRTPAPEQNGTVTKKLFLKTGRVLEYHSLALPGNGQQECGWFFRDITSQEQKDRFRDLTTETLSVLNEIYDLRHAMKTILLSIKTSFGFDAVGLRLMDGEDFPYFETTGFSEDFIASERFLCVKDAAGKVRRARDGKANLECLCGQVVCGRTDPSLPHFTKDGSFVTNSTTKLLAGNKHNLRARCPRDGYESVALIPLKSNASIIGLLQLNDKKKDRFTPDGIAYLENLSIPLGIALAKLHAEQLLTGSEEKLRALFESSTEHMFLLNNEGIYLASNSGHGNTKFPKGADLINKNISDVYPPELAMHYKHKIAEVLVTGQSVHFKYKLPASNRHYADILYPVNNISGTEKIIGGISRDITESIESENTITALREHMLTIREEERAHMARELHDGVGQKLVSVKLNVEALALEDSVPVAIKKKISHQQCVLNNALQEIRRIARHLMPVELEKLGMLASIKNLCGEIEEQSGISINCSISGAVPETLPATLSLHVFRITQEALTNVLKHAKATHVEVAVFMKGTDLVVELMDNGSGCHSGVKSKLGVSISAGMQNIRERAALLGGKIEFISSDKGSVLILQTPLIAK